MMYDFGVMNSRAAVDFAVRTKFVNSRDTQR